MEIMHRIAAIVSVSTLLACGPAESGKAETKAQESCSIELVVLGIGQDAGAPQIGNPNDPAWKDLSKKLYATSLGLLDHDNGKRYLFEATPDIREQMQIMDTLLPYDGEGPYIDGIFLTHAHIGHYGGLMFLGRESMGAKGVPVYVMPRMKDYLESNGPWSQLVELGNIELLSFENSNAANHSSFLLSDPIKFLGEIEVKASKAPHRDEFSETVKFYIAGPNKSVSFIPDIDSWKSQAELYAAFSFDAYVFPNSLKYVDYAFLDATFYDDNELPGRDMSKIPHPRVTESMDLIEAAGDESLKDKARFIHINHTNPLRDKNSPQYKKMTDRGFKLAYRGERFCL